MYQWKIRQKKAKQKWVWLNRYDFAYAEKDTVSIGLSKLKRIASELIQNARNQVDKVAKKWKIQAIKQEEKKVERVAPIIIRKVIKELYQVSFCLLGNFGWWKCNSTMRILKNISSRMKKDIKRCNDLFRLENIIQS